MSLWELINPSDKITFKAPTHDEQLDTLHCIVVELKKAAGR